MAECVQVAVSNATFHFDKLYSYSVPAHLQDRVFVGSMVLVPFGRGAAARMGVVLGLDAPEAAGKRLKSLYDAAPEQARLSDELLRLVYYLKEHTFCTYYEAVKAIIPYGAQYKAVNTAPYRSCKSSLCAIPSRYTGAKTPPGRDAVPKSSRLPGTRWLSAPKHRRSWKSRA